MKRPLNKDKIDKTGYAPGACWNWTGTIEHGYGRVKIEGRKYQAHRVAYAMYYGDFDPDQVVRHQCHNKRCVNPAHLKLGTHADNVEDKVRAGRQAKGEGNGASTLKEHQVIEIRRSYAQGGVSYRALADQFEVSKSAIFYVIKGGGWKHLGTSHV